MSQGFVCWIEADLKAPMAESEFVKVAKALADPTRHEMVRALREHGELNCSAMCKLFPLSQPTISHHIKMLESAGLISVRREGQFHVLSLNASVVQTFVAELTGAGVSAVRQASKSDSPSGVGGPAKPTGHVRPPSRLKTAEPGKRARDRNA